MTSSSSAAGGMTVPRRPATTSSIAEKREPGAGLSAADAAAPRSSSFDMPSRSRASSRAVKVFLMKVGSISTICLRCSRERARPRSADPRTSVVRKRARCRSSRSFGAPSESAMLAVSGVTCTPSRARVPALEIRTSRSARRDASKTSVSGERQILPVHTAMMLSIPAPNCECRSERLSRSAIKLAPCTTSLAMPRSRTITAEIPRRGGRNVRSGRSRRRDVTAAGRTGDSGVAPSADGIPRCWFLPLSVAA